MSEVIISNATISRTMLSAGVMEAVHPDYIVTIKIQHIFINGEECKHQWDFQLLHPRINTNPEFEPNFGDRHVTLVKVICLPNGSPIIFNRSEFESEFGSLLCIDYFAVLGENDISRLLHFKVYEETPNL
jgi:hypothetical protein